MSVVKIKITLISHYLKYIKVILFLKVLFLQSLLFLLKFSF